MNKRIEVKEVSSESEKLMLIADAYDGEAQQLEAKGQILADSDRIAFIYILENPEHFTYLSIPAAYWPHLEKARKESASVWARINETDIELEHFCAELEELVQNIAGNANYGDEMEGKVSEVFASLA
ncbi:hypothetical protein CEF21_08800 [Bacillus sp. FJAT-42376]|uniref:UPF0738 family protein n=1 Tax=Bacillus sp. FJAT-42376 TaxID=2014076 RepID=UPI000F4E6929|nr:hypothetical protein [Bacillus sp. FJAT-42376]AZB42381.1 hypothetical protein CEF21_08800 [Bacillus sp. FJAT-42376]